MTYIVSITSQGQISIPAPIRRKLGLNKYQKAIVSEEGGRLVVEPVKDLMDLAGAFKTNIKPPSKKEIREGFEEYLAKRGMGIKE